MLYKFQPVGFPTTAQFYMFNDHFKSGTNNTDKTSRGTEAGIVNTAANGLPTNTPIIYAGDYNPTDGVTDAGYAAVITGTTGAGNHNNHGIDPLNPTNDQSQVWSNAANKRFDTESPATSAFFPGQGISGMDFRDDFLLNSPGMVSGNAIHYLANSFVNFGNTNTHTYSSAITTGTAATFASQLTGYSTAQASTVLTQLAQGRRPPAGRRRLSDHRRAGAVDARARIDRWGGDGICSTPGR